MTRAHRTAHPFLWALIALIAAGVIWLGLKARPEEARNDIPAAALEVLTGEER